MNEYGYREITVEEKRAIGNRITDVRIKRGMRSMDVADRLGISKDAYSRIENGYSLPSLPHMYTLCFILDVSMDYLMFGEKDEYGYLAEIRVLLQGKPQQVIRKVIRILKAFLCD